MGIFENLKTLLFDPRIECQEFYFFKGKFFSFNLKNSWFARVGNSGKSLMGNFATKVKLLPVKTSAIIDRLFAKPVSQFPSRLRVFHTRSSLIM